MTDDSTFWDKIADDYARRPVEDPDAFERKTAITAAMLTQNDTFLDIGCGTGSLALLLAPHAAHVHGLDISPEMIRIARGKTAAQGVHNLTFHTGPFDARFTAIPEGSLAGVGANSFLHLIGDRDAALAQMFRLLRPGGFLVSSTPCLGESWVPYTPLLTVMRWLGKAPRVWVVTRQMLAEDIRRAGFEDIRFPDVGAKPEIGFVVARCPR